MNVRITFAPPPLRITLVAFVTLVATLASPVRADELRYTVRPGDSAASVAGALLLDPSYRSALLRHNQLADEQPLTPGSTLQLPWSWLKPRASMLTLGAVTGPVDSDLQGPWTRLAEQARTTLTLRAGQSLRTGERGSVLLQLPDGSTIQVRPQSELRLLGADVIGLDTPLVAIELMRGALESGHRPPIPTGGRLLVTTTATGAILHGSRFRITVDDEGTRTEVLEGTARLQSPAGEVELGPAQGVRARPGTGLPPATTLLGAPDLSALPVTVARLPLTVHHAPVDGAVRYRTRLLRPPAGAEDGTAPELVMERTGPEATVMPPAGAPLPPGPYIVQVRGIDPLGLEGRESTRPIELLLPSSPPTPRWPPVDAWVVSGATRLEWQAHATPVADRPATFHVQLARDAQFQTLVAQARTGLTTWSTGPLEPGLYHWRVAQLDGDRIGPYGEARTMHVPDRIPSLAEPELGERLRLRWTDPGGIGALRLQMARDAEFAQPIIDQPVSGSQLELPRPPAGQYLLRLLAIDAEGRSMPSGETRELIVPAQARATLASPLEWLSRAKVARSGPDGSQRPSTSNPAAAR